jgi:hypothetical protein
MLLEYNRCDFVRLESLNFIKSVTDKLLVWQAYKVFEMDPLAEKGIKSRRKKQLLKKYK